MLHTDICIAGAGVIGFSIALEMQARNLNVTVVEAGQPLREASWAAAGMLAARDPHNPSELSPLSELSVSVYSKFLEGLETLGGIAVPFQTYHTLQLNDALHAPIPASAFDPAMTADSLPAGFVLLDERSIDPRQLASSLVAAVAASPIRVLTESPVISIHSLPGSVRISTATRRIEAAQFIDCTGAWCSDPDFSVTPIKGQMLAVALPAELPLQIAVRNAAIYIVPRTTGSQAGRAIIGATVEDLGFDTVVHGAQIEDLRQQAIALLPQLAGASVLDSWSGLRPATPDRLPLLGAHPGRRNHWIATGHFRNGILLAPATARVMAQLLLGEVPSAPLDIFAPSRLAVRNAVNI